MRAVLAAGALSIAACASPQASGAAPIPHSDGGLDRDAPSADAVAETGIDGPDDAALDQADASSVDVVEEATAPGDYCAVDGGDAGANGADDGACTPGDTQGSRCGECGTRERACGTSGAWGAWSPCSESDQAQCALCSTATVGCGFCGTRPLACRVVDDSCRWTLGACDASGECSPGSYEADAASCAVGAWRVRWCSSACAWGPWAPCSPQAPAWDPLEGAPIGARSDFVSVSTGTSWILWGGRDPLGAPLDDGASFDAASSSWSTLPPATLADAGGEAGASTAFAPRSGAAAAWTGEELIVWGGQGAGAADTKGDGARLLPSDGTWSRMSEIDAPSPRVHALMVWDDADGMAIVWGGQAAGGNAQATGGRYSVAADNWSAVAASPLDARLGASAVWDPLRRRMIVWGGRSAGGIVRRDGAAYDPLTDSWSAIADAPVARESHVAFWDPAGDRMIVLLGRDGFWTGQRGDGAAWHAASNTWTMLADLSVSGYDVNDGRSASFALGYVWVVGGDGAGTGSCTAGGARYDVALDAWSALPAMACGRSGHAAAFLDRLVVWGGRPATSGWVESAERLRPMP